MKALLLVFFLALNSCSTYPTCPVPKEPDKGYLKWDKEKKILDADAGGLELFRNYIAARKVCGGNP